MAKIKTEQKDKVLSTRSIILDKSLEIINGIGVVDFRIDSLATTLDLSPGNITYHFSKKEDICLVLWTDFIEKLEVYSATFSNLLDVKQTYLIFRAINRLMYDYRGIIMFRGSDIRVINDDEASDNSFSSLSGELFSRACSVLRKNGYIDNSSEQLASPDILSDLQTIVLRSWINKASIESILLADEKSVSDIVNYNALLVLYSMYPSFTDKGRREFAEVARFVKDKNVNDE